jgi:LysM repeat protein
VATTGEVYTVVRGDTLFGIANKLGVDVGRLLGANGLQENSLIVPGQRLGVPQGGALPASTAAPPPPTTAAPPPPTTAAPPPPRRPAPTQPTTPVATTGNRYTVVQGDTLSGIARKLGVNLGQLLQANGMNANTVIQPGQQLVIPQGGEPPARPPQPPAASAPTTASPAAPGAVVPNETAAGCQAPNSEEADGTEIVFAPGNVLDNDPATAWRCETSEADKSLTFTFAEPTRLTSVGLIGGYVKVDPLTGVDRFPQNHRVRQVRWTFSDGSTVTQDLADSREMQTMPVDVTTTGVKMEILATYPPGDVELPRDMVPVAEVQFVSG